MGIEGKENLQYLGCPSDVCEGKCACYIDCLMGLSLKDKPLFPYNEEETDEELNI